MKPSLRVMWLVEPVARSIAYELPLHIPLLRSEQKRSRRPFGLKPRVSYQPSPWTILVASGSVLGSKGISTRGFAIRGGLSSQSPSTIRCTKPST